jgi:hypothetical protein
MLPCASLAPGMASVDGIFTDHATVSGRTWLAKAHQLAETGLIVSRSARARFLSGRRRHAFAEPRRLGRAGESAYPAETTARPAEHCKQHWRAVQRREADAVGG